MKAFFHLLAIAVIFLMTATAVETRASERLDVNPPPLLEQISVSNSCELINAHETSADIAATCAEWLGLPDRFGATSFCASLLG